MNLDSLVKFQLGDFVYLKCKPDECGMVTAIVFRDVGASYYITWGSGEEKTHTGIELTKEKAFILNSDNKGE